MKDHAERSQEGWEWAEKSRTEDRRWLALYTLALTVAVLCSFILFHMRRMDLSYAMANSVQTYLFTRLIPIGAAGLIGTGVALC